VSRGPAPFTQRNATRLMRAVIAAGLSVAKVEVDNAGKIVVIVGDTAKTDANNPLDQWMADHARTS
jgi:hypothetical protein